MRGVNVGCGCAVMPGCDWGTGEATTPAGRGAGVAVFSGCAGTGVAGLLVTGIGVGGGAACARVENALATTTSVTAQTPKAARRTGGLYVFAICEMRHVSACLS